MDNKSHQGIMAQWRPRQYVLTGAGVILAISAVTIVFSILLRPANIYFSVSGFSVDKDLNDVLKSEGSAAAAYAFNLTAHNPSRRAGVVYRYVLVSMKMGSNGRPKVRETSVPAHVTDEPPLQQGRNSYRSMGVQAVLDNEFFNFYSGPGAYATISVSAQAQFKVGLARSRFYNLRLKCTRIEFASLGTQAGTANCDYVV